jgi:hypothetical protein
MVTAIPDWGKKRIVVLSTCIFFLCALACPFIHSIIREEDPRSDASFLLVFSTVPCTGIPELGEYIAMLMLPRMVVAIMVLFRSREMLAWLITVRRDRGRSRQSRPSPPPQFLKHSYTYIKYIL